MFFFFNETATTELYTLSLHDALPIYAAVHARGELHVVGGAEGGEAGGAHDGDQGREHVPGRVRIEVAGRSEEHTSELQSRQYIVCRLLIEKKQYYHSHCIIH